MVKNSPNPVTLFRSPFPSRATQCLCYASQQVKLWRLHPLKKNVSFLNTKTCILFETKRPSLAPHARAENRKKRTDAFLASRRK
jgi:hypothetical protein